MNRRAASAFDSDDSESDWDTTVADPPSKHEPAQPVASAPAPTVQNNIEQESTYATVVAKPRVSLRGSGDDITGSSNAVNGGSPKSTPRTDKNKISMMASPPPHLTSFKDALYSNPSDDSSPAPSLPPRRYEQVEGKSNLYTLPETDLLPQEDIVNWDDSDAEERVLKELQQNIGKEKQRQQQLKNQQQQQQQQQQQELQHQSPPQQQYLGEQEKKRERKVTLAVPGDPMPVQSSKVTKSDMWRASPDRPSPPRHKISETSLSKGDFNKALRGSPSSVSSPTMLADVKPSLSPRGNGGPGFGKASPLFVKDTEGKKYVFYFEEGSPHFVDVEEEDFGAVLPEKIEDIERLFRRVWREVFAVLRVIISFFVLFISELLRFLLNSVVRILVLDTIAALGDQLLKPFLTVMFNSVLQPLFALAWNVFNSAFQALDPLVRLTGVIMSQVAMVLAAFRLFVINQNAPPAASHDVNMV
ncbi:hypothetical protein EGW08_018021 [Elysia chlorotica]|uniref:Uncharacterized protein n=1 Tax=Elysia chlorotica TaxID=188477 RepID=A0A3S1BT16_ELYCH|nr:hypothetical protein EGW08_018021 [Elysia chlorotica]